MKALVAFGEALIDLLQDPATPSLYHRNAGGAPANVAVGFARLGGDARFMGMLANDAFGNFLLDELDRHGVKLGLVRRTDAANTALAVVSLADDGERSFDFYRPPAADLLFTPADIDPCALADAPWLHLCSNSLTDQPARAATLALLDAAAAAHCPVSIDVNWRPALWRGAAAAGRELIASLLPRAHLVKCSVEEWRWLAGVDDEGDAGADALADRCFDGATALIVVTDGAAPVRCRTRTGGWSVHPVRAVDMVDSTAAGDAFVAGLLHRLARAGAGPAQLPALVADATVLADHIGFAARCGAFACGRYGAFAALPAPADVAGAGGGS